MCGTNQLYDTDTGSIIHVTTSPAVSFCPLLQWLERSCSPRTIHASVTHLRRPVTSPAHAMNRFAFCQQSLVTHSNAHSNAAVQPAPALPPTWFASSIVAGRSLM